MKKYIVFILITLLYAGLAEGANYYVNSSGSGSGSLGTWGAGNDGNNGTSISTPKLTWDSVYSLLATSGDTVYVAGTLEPNRVLLRKSYNIIGDTVKTATLKPTGGGGYNQFVRADSGVVTCSFTDVIITADAAVATPLITSNQNGNALIFTRCTLSVNNASITGLVSTLTNPTTYTFTYCTITTTNHNSANQSLAFYGGTVSFNGCTLNFNTASAAGLSFYGTYTTIALTNNTITYAANVTYPMLWNSYPPCTNFTATSNTIYNNQAFTSGRPLLYASGRLTNVTVSGNKVYSTGNTDILSIASKVACTAEITNNLIYNNGTLSSMLIGSESTSEDDHSKITASVYKNIIYGQGFYNPSSSTTDHGIGNLYQTATIYNNYVYGCSNGCVAKGHEEGGVNHGQSYIYNNVFSNTGKSSGILVRGQNDVVIYNNTITASIPTFSTAGLVLDTNISETPNYAPLRCTFKNNLIVLPDTYTLVNKASGTFAAIDYNSYWNGVSAATLDFSYEGVLKTLTQWNGYGYDANSISSNSWILSDIHPVLRISSPCIKAGVNLGTTYSNVFHPTTSFAGTQTLYTVAQPANGAWNIGAYSDIKSSIFQ